MIRVLSEVMNRIFSEVRSVVKVERKVGEGRGRVSGFRGKPDSRFESLRDVERYACDFRSSNLYFGLMTITESIWPFPSSSVAELVGSLSPTPSTRNL